MHSKVSFLAILILITAVACAPGNQRSLESNHLSVSIRDDASVQVVDKASGEQWTLGSPRLLLDDESEVKVEAAPQVNKSGDELKYAADDGTEFAIRMASDGAAFEYSVEPGPNVAEVFLVDAGLPLGPGEDNYYAIPHRLGILVPVSGEEAYTRRFPAYSTGNGYSMAMAGAVRSGMGIMLHWEDPYTEIVVDYTPESDGRLTMGLALRESARSVTVQPLGEADYVDIAKAYRPVAKQRGFLKTLAEKMKDNPDVEKFFGSADFKPFAYMPQVPNTRWNETDEVQVVFNFTFDEAARLAEHFKNDLGIERSLLVLNGWINGGYDNKHPDILPAAKIMGGNQGLSECSRRVKELGWVFGLHDNYQDMYKEAESFDESYLIKNADGTPRKGGVWAGGPCWLICSRKSVELASRPQNVPKVVELCDPDLYFSDTIFAAGLYECHDPDHPTSKVDDIEAKQGLCDYLRDQVGMFGSEEGREWGVAHADYFEGLMSHKTGYHVSREPADIIVPMFEIVFGDCIPMYTHQSDRPRPDEPEKILHHVLYAEMPVYYFGNHIYWQGASKNYESDDESKMLYAQGGRLNTIDQFIKNTYEFLSPLHKLTATMPMTDHEFLTPDRKVEKTRFGDDVEIVVNYGEEDFDASGTMLPQYGFLVRSPELVAFCARRHEGVDYPEPALFVIESEDGRPIAESGSVRVYRGFGKNQVQVNGELVEVDTERVVSGG